MSYRWLLGALLALLLLEPVLAEDLSVQWAFDAIFVGTLVTAVWTIGRQRHAWPLVGLALLVPALAAKSSLYVWPSPTLAAVWLIFVLAFLIFAIVVFLSDVLGTSTVTQDTIAGAVCVYLLLALIWAMAFALIEVARPGSFEVRGQPLADLPYGESPEIAQFLYLSLVTLTTVGYGDVLAVTPLAGRIAVLEAVVGQFYLAVLVARLVSRQVSPPR